MAVAKKDKVKGHCPQCGPDKWAIIKGAFTRNESQDDIWVRTDHRILQCPACETVYHQTNMICSEDIDYLENTYIEDIKHSSPLARSARPIPG